MNEKKKYVRFQYTEKDLEDACQAIFSGSLSLNKAHEVYKIPKSTLHNKITHKVPMQRRLGAFTQLTEVEESKLAEWVIKKAKCGFPMHPTELQSTVKTYLDANNRKTNFIENKPGRKWLQLFLSRHPEISKRNAEVISRARASVTETSIRKWFEELINFVKENEAEDIFEHPERVFNADETGVQMCPKSGALLTPKNFKNSYQIASGKEKEQVTVLCNICANGEAAPPLLVYPYKRIPRDIVASVPDEWGIGRSDSGWMISETFLDYIKNVFHPWLIKKTTKFPIIMFLDGHKSHINKELFEYCSENQILLFCLYPNATHILQPCDVSFFKSLKNAWRESVTRFKATNPTKVLSRSNFARVFEEAYKNTISKTNVISNGFRKCGLYPLDPNSVDYTKCVTSTQVPQGQTVVNVTRTISDSDVKSTMKVLEYLTSDGDRNDFNACINENKSHEHPYFPIWRFCKSFLSTNDMPLIQQQQDKEDDVNSISSKIGLPQEKECVILTEFDVAINGECVNEKESVLPDLTHVTEFDEAFNGSSSPLDTNYTGIEMGMLLNDENLVFEFRENVSPLSASGHETSMQITHMSKSAIPLPWYQDKIRNDKTQTNNNYKICESLTDEKTKDFVSDETCKFHLDEKTTHIDKEVICETQTVEKPTDIDTFLNLPHLNHPTRKRKTTIMPYGITCKKMKDYLNEQDRKKKEKEESIRIKKALRIEKTKALEEKKKTLRNKRVLKLSSDNVEVAINESGENSKRTKVLPIKKTKPHETEKELPKKISIEKYDCDINTFDETNDKEEAIWKEILKMDKMEEAKEQLCKENEKENDLNKTNKSETTLIRTGICSETKINLADIAFGNYILVKFEELKSTKLFVGRVLMINDEEQKIKVDFLRKKRQKKLELDSELFVYPQVKDVDEVHIDSVVDILVVEKTTRRGEIIFTKELINVQ